MDEEMKEKMKKMSKENRPSAPLGADLKWRYFWRPSSRTQSVIPKGFPEWEETMNSCGQKMMAAIEVCHLNTNYYYLLSSSSSLIFNWR